MNIAEGSGEFSAAEKARFYRMAKRSATECAAILDICSRIRLSQDSVLASGRDLLLRIVAMLIQMIRRMATSGTGAGTGTGAGRGRETANLQASRPTTCLV